MGSLIYTLNVSLDGYIETPDRSLLWTPVDEELLTWTSGAYGTVKVDQSARE